MPKTLTRIAFKSGRTALLLRNEKGHKLYYDEGGVMLVNVEEPWEITEELGTIETEAEFTELTGIAPSAFLVTCPFCNRESLAMKTGQGWKCLRCDSFVPKDESSSELIN
jgi:hypothetical protein